MDKIGNQQKRILKNIIIIMMVVSIILIVIFAAFFPSKVNDNDLGDGSGDGGGITQTQTVEVYWPTIDAIIFDKAIIGYNGEIDPDKAKVIFNEELTSYDLEYDWFNTFGITWELTDYNNDLIFECEAKEEIDYYGTKYNVINRKKTYTYLLNDREK